LIESLRILRYGFVRAGNFGAENFVVFFAKIGDNVRMSG
jgi:hypothetical protein